MRNKVKTGSYLIACILIMFAIYIFSGNSVHATGVVSPDQFYFGVDSQDTKPGSEIELTREQALIYIKMKNSSTGKDGLPDDATVEWITSEPKVVSLTPHTENGFIWLNRKGPGYSTITAIVRYGNFNYTLSILVKVNMEINHAQTGTEIVTTTNDRILKMYVGDTKQIYLKYVDYKKEAETVSGEAITAAAVTWESSNESVVTVDEEGKVKAEGSGSATITITSNTMSSKDRVLKETLTVVVVPTFYYSNGSDVWYSSESNNNFVPVEIPLREFFITSQATFATNLKWEVYDASSNKKLTPDSKKLNYYVSENSGTVYFTNVKAGTYEIYAFANEKYNVNTRVPYAYMKIIVPIDLGNEDIVMNVNDTYDLTENSNIPDFSIFNVWYEKESDKQIAVVNSKGVITAKSKGQITIHLKYIEDSNLYDPGSEYAEEKTIKVTVIDSIALSATEAVLYTQGTLYLHAVVTDRTVPIVWSSSNPSVAKVEDGLVTALKPGVAIITAQQTINGVVKSATCEITVRQSVTSIKLDPANINIAIGEYKTLKATLTPKINGIKLVWRTSNDKVVKIVETSDLTVTIQGVSGGTAVISAINEENIVVGYCHVVVRQPVTSIKLSDTSVNINLGARSIQLRAIVYPENATNKEVKWTSSNTSIARVNDNGLVTLIRPGEVTIIATSVDNPDAMALCNITIEIPVTSVALDDKEVTMYVGETKRLTYTVLPVNASKNQVTWTSTNPSVATVDAAGRVTARQVGTAVIMVKTLDGGHTAYCTVNVKQIAQGVKFAESEIEMYTGQVHELEYALVPVNATDAELFWESSDTKVAVVDETGKVTAKGAGVTFIIARTKAGGMSYVKVTVKEPVKGLILNFTEKTIYVRDTFELKVSLTPSEASNQQVEWKSSNTNVATVSENGIVTGVASGTAIITCTTKEGGFTASCFVVVRERLTDMKLNYDEYRLSLGKTFTLTVMVDGKPITDQQFKWTSSNSDVASVNKNGKVTGNKLGKAVITAYALDGSGGYASCEVEVVRPVTRITLNKNYLTMTIGQTVQLKAKVEPSNATYKTPYWTVEGAGDVVYVDDDGYVTALKEGTVNVIARARDDSEKFAICQVVVLKPVPATSVILSDKTITMVEGESKTINYRLSPVNSTDNVTWSTDNSSVATVSNSGKVTAKSTGTAYITAMTDSGKTATTQVNVVGLNVKKLTLEQYDRYTLYVEGATSRVNWHSTNPDVATVQNGNIIARAIGTTTIVARVNGRELTCKVTVVKIK